MDATKRARLEAGGWSVGDAAEFLELTAEEAAFVDLKLALAVRLRELRGERGWTQAQLARQIRSSQSRVAKMEAADGTVSLDLLVRTLLSLGASRQELGLAVAGDANHRAAELAPA